MTFKRFEIRPQCPSLHCHTLETQLRHAEEENARLKVEIEKIRGDMRDKFRRLRDGIPTAVRVPEILGGAACWIRRGGGRPRLRE